MAAAAVRVVEAGVWCSGGCAPPAARHPRLLRACLAPQHVSALQPTAAAQSRTRGTSGQEQDTAAQEEGVQEGPAVQPSRSRARQLLLPAWPCTSQRAWLLQLQRPPQLAAAQACCTFGACSSRWGGGRARTRPVTGPSKLQGPEPWLLQRWGPSPLRLHRARSRAAALLRPRCMARGWRRPHWPWRVHRARWRGCRPRARWRRAWRWGWQQVGCLPVSCDGLGLNQSWPFAGPPAVPSPAVRAQARWCCSR